MNREEAKALAKKMVKAKASAFSGRISIAEHTEDRQMLTEHATDKVLREFWELVTKSPDYTALEKMYCAEQLLGDIL